MKRNQIQTPLSAWPIPRHFGKEKRHKGSKHQHVGQKNGPRAMAQTNRSTNRRYQNSFSPDPTCKRGSGVPNAELLMSISSDINADLSEYTSRGKHVLHGLIDPG